MKCKYCKKTIYLEDGKWYHYWLDLAEKLPSDDMICDENGLETYSFAEPDYFSSYYSQINGKEL